MSAFLTPANLSRIQNARKTVTKKSVSKAKVFVEKSPPKPSKEAARRGKKSRFGSQEKLFD